MPAEWTNNNMAHVSTWGSLKDLKQHGKRFEQAATLCMKQLDFYNPAESPAQRRVTAKPWVVAFMALTKAWPAEFEEGCTYGKTLDELLDAFVDGDKTMPQLAQIVDDCYRFPTEA